MFARLATLTGKRADLAALALGALAAAALPPVCAVPVLLLATPGLLALIDGAPGPGTAARRGWWFGFGHNLLGLYWITEAILIEAARFWWLVPLAVPALAAVMALFIAAPAGLARLARRGWPRVLTLAGGWVLADLARQFIATGFPWNPWGSVWELPGLPGDVMIQPAAWIGVPGLTFLTVLLSALPVLGWRWRTAGAALLAGWAAIGFERLQAPLPPPPGLHVVLVQGNIAQGQKWDRALVMRIFDRYLGLTRDGITQAGSGPAIVVWPETASPFLLQTDAAARAAISEATSNAPALVGAVRFGQDGWPRNSLFAVLPGGRLAGTGQAAAPQPSAPANGAPANGTQVNGGPASGRPANGAQASGAHANDAHANDAQANGAQANGSQASGGPANGAPAGNGLPGGGVPSNGLPGASAPSGEAAGEMTGIYDKWHLVPFGEYQPSWFPAPFQVVPGGGFRPGPGPRTLDVPGLPPVGPLICYEAIFPAQVVDEVDRPAWMVNITNDAWFGNSTGPRQHLAAARMRAVEEGLPLLRAANTGISAAVDPRGHELARLGMERTGVLIVDLPSSLPPTPFARLGLRIPAMIAFTALCLGLIAPGGVAFRTRRGKKEDF